MSQATIVIEEEQVQRLDAIARQEGRTVDAVVSEALDEYLRRRTLSSSARVTLPRHSIPSEQWQAQFRDVLQRLHAAVPPDLTSEEIEREITAASEEVRQSGFWEERASRG